MEIAFLCGHGVRPEVLSQAAAVAAETGVGADDALLRTGLVSERLFYRALAAELGLPFLDAFRLDSSARFPHSIAVGLAPLARGEGADFVMAPAGARLGWLLLGGRRLQPGLAIAMPTALAAEVLKVRAEAVAEEAANGLVRSAPGLSYRGGATARQFLAGLAVLVGCGAVTLDAWPPIGTAVTLLSTLAFFGMVQLRIAAALHPVPVGPGAERGRADNRDLPTYTVLVALHRESRILPQLVSALRALDYPAAKLDLKLVIEADDAETRDALARTALPAHLEVVVAPPGRPRTKPRALNVALPLARGDLIVVYDAEDRPDPGQLRDAAATFARLGPEVACLQGRLVIDNTGDSWLTRLFTIEYAALFDVINPALAAWHFPVPLGGTSTHFRTAALRAVHGWDAWNVTEDADLGIRLAVQGYRVADLPSATLEEAPATLSAWMSQRTRWMKGFMQVCITHSRRPVRAFRALGPAKFFAAVTMTFGTVAAALAYPLCTVVSIGAFLDAAALGPTSVGGAVRAASGIVLFGAGLVAMLAPAVVGVCRRRWWGLLPWALVLPLYYVLASIAAWRGLVELMVDPSRWNKTEHGLAKTSRAGSVTDAAEAPPRPPRAAARG